MRRHVLCFDISKVDSDSDATNSVYYNDKCEHLEVTSWNSTTLRVGFICSKYNPFQNKRHIRSWRSAYHCHRRNTRLYVHQNAQQTQLVLLPPAGTDGAIRNFLRTLTAGLS